MRGVLSETDLRIYAWTSLLSANMVTVVDDGHAFPYAATFLWPDESPGMLIRLAEDANQFPTQLELTHVAAGRKIIVDIPSDGFLVALIRSGNFFYKEFETQADMLADDSVWTNAICNNANAGDKYVTTWVKLPVSNTLTVNGSDILVTVAGVRVMRTSVREYLEPTIVVSSGTVTYATATVQPFPTIDDAKASNVDVTFVLTTNRSGEHRIFKKDPTNDETTVEDVDWFKNTIGVHYNTR